MAADGNFVLDIVSIYHPAVPFDWPIINLVSLVKFPTLKHLEGIMWLVFALFGLDVTIAVFFDIIFDIRIVID